MMSLLSFLLIWLGLSGAFTADKGDAGLLPPDGFQQVWRRSERMRIFTSQDLYGYIDGGAEVFLEFGFEQLTILEYLSAAGESRDEIQIEVYRMADQEAAAGIYLLKCGQEQPDGSFAEPHTLNRYQLVFFRDRYFVIINNPEGREAIRPGMLEFARYVAGRLPASTTQEAADILPKEGLVPGSIRLARGPYALQAVYLLGEGDILQLGRKLTAVSASYREAGETYTQILVEYPDPGAAGSAFAYLEQNLDSYLKVEEKSPRRLVFKDYAGKYGIIRLESRRLGIEVHLSNRPPLKP